MKWEASLLLVVLSFYSSVWAAEEVSNGRASRCHLYVDYDLICTLELTGTSGRDLSPILNIIAFTGGELEIQPSNVHLFDAGNREVEVRAFSFDSGNPNEPYHAQYLKVRGGEFVGLDLLGDFGQLGELGRVDLDVGKDRLTLEPIDCGEFETLAEKISEIDLTTTDLIAKFELLGIRLFGKREEK